MIVKFDRVSRVGVSFTAVTVIVAVAVPLKPLPVAEVAAWTLKLP